MKVYVPSGVPLVIIDRSETAYIDAEFDIAWMDYDIDEGQNMVKIINLINDSSWSIDIPSLADESGTPLGNVSSVRTYLMSLKSGNTPIYSILASSDILASSAELASS